MEERQAAERSAQESVGAEEAEMAALRARLASAEQEARSWESKAVEADATALKAENARAAVRNNPSTADKNQTPSLLATSAAELEH